MYLSRNYKKYKSIHIQQAPINDDARRNNQNLPGMGGLFNHINSNLYAYAANNPVHYIDPDGNYQSDAQKELTKILSGLASSSSKMQQLVKDNTCLEIRRSIMDNGDNGSFYQSTIVVKVFGYELNMASTQSTPDHARLNKDNKHKGLTLKEGTYQGTLLNKSGSFLRAISITGNGVSSKDAVLVHPNVFTGKNETAPYSSNGKPLSLGCQVMELDDFNEVLDILNSLGIKGGQSTNRNESWVEGDCIKIEILAPIPEYN